MIKTIQHLIKKYWDIVTYLFFGVLTTIVNYIVYLPCYNLMGMSATISNMVAWVVAVTFAYLTNKPFVFKSNDWSAKTVIPELTKFVGCRVGSGVAETLVLFLAVDLFGWNGNLWKLVTQVMVTVMNYVASKLVVFRKK